MNIHDLFSDNLNSAGNRLWERRRRVSESAKTTATHSGAVAKLKSALLSQQQKLQDADADQVYDMIDKIMTDIAKSYDITGKQLHDAWVNKYHKVPDSWIKSALTEGRVDSPVSNAIINRLVNQRPALLARFGPEAVMAAVDEVAEWVGEVDEIGSSDVSGWVSDVDRYLRTSAGEGIAEGQSMPVMDQVKIAYMTVIMNSPTGITSKEFINYWQGYLKETTGRAVSTEQLLELLREFNKRKSEIHRELISKYGEYAGMLDESATGVAEGYAGIDDTDTVGFSVNSEAAYTAVMKRFGDVIDHDETSGIMYAPARAWPEIEMTAFDADGTGAVKDDGVTEATGDRSFDNMMKTVKKGTLKQATADRRETRKQSQQQARDAFGTMFGGGNPASDLKIKEQGVAEGQLDEASARDVLLSLLDKFYADMKLPPRQGGRSGELDIESPGTRVWTRGDGTRYRKPGSIKATYFPDDKKQAAKAAANFWPWLLKQPGVKSIGQVSGEFGNDPMKDAVSYKGLYFSGRPDGVEFGSMSRITNQRSVWRQKKDQSGVAEADSLTTYIIIYKDDQNQKKQKKVQSSSATRAQAKFEKAYPNYRVIGLKDWEKGVAKGFMNTIANKVMGAAPEQPKYKVGQRVKYETSPHQPDWKDGGRGVGVITAYKNGHYMINGNPVNHFEIKGVVEQGVDENKVSDFVRGQNYKRLARRSSDRSTDALDAAIDSRSEADWDEFAKQQDQYTDRKQRAKSLGAKFDEGHESISESVTALSEDLKKWFKDKWVRFGPDGKIRGDCARGSSKEGKPKCLPKSKAQSLGKKGRAGAAAKKRRQDPDANRSGAAKNVATKVNESNLDEACWKGYHKDGMKTMFGKRYPNCVKNKSTNEQQSQDQCPQCGGPMYHESMMNEKQDACYHKVKSRYKVWPSAYASGALVQCRKQGASNWGTKSESTELPQVSANNGSKIRYAIVHKMTKQIMSTHDDLESAKDEWRGLDKDQRPFYRLMTTAKSPKPPTMDESIVVLPPNFPDDMPEEEQRAAWRKWLRNETNKAVAAQTDIQQLANKLRKQQQEKRNRGESDYMSEAAVNKLTPYTPDEIRRYNRWAEQNGHGDYDPKHLFTGSVGDKMMFVGNDAPIPVEVTGLDQSAPTGVTVRTLDGSNKELDMDWINYKNQVKLRPMTPEEQSAYANKPQGQLAEMDMDSPEFQQALMNLKKKAQQGPRQTEFNPKTGKYRTVPVKSVKKSSEHMTESMRRRLAEMRQAGYDV